MFGVLEATRLSLGWKYRTVKSISQRVRKTHVFAQRDDDRSDSELAKILEQDIERLRSKQTQRIDEEKSTGSGGVQELVNKLLVADSIFVFAAFAALGVSLAVQGIFHSEVLTNLWYALWPTVFQPAIGILMLAAISSGILNWFSASKEEAN